MKFRYYTVINENKAIPFSTLKVSALNLGLMVKGADENLCVILDRDGNSVFCYRGSAGATHFVQFDENRGAALIVKTLAEHFGVLINDNRGVRINEKSREELIADEKFSDMKYRLNTKLVKIKGRRPKIVGRRGEHLIPGRRELLTILLNVKAD